MDIGTPADYLDTSLALAAREGIDTGAAAPTICRDGACRAERPVGRCGGRGGAMLRECVVTDGVRVPADTSWHGVTIRDATGELAPGERRIEGLAIASL